MSSIERTKREVCQAVKSIGIKVLEQGITGSNHIYVVGERNGVVRKIFFAKTPGDHRALRNGMTQAKRLFEK